jgi:hypothetical protein
VLWPERDAGSNSAYASGVEIKSVAFAVLDYFGIAGDKADAGRLGRGTHRGHHLMEPGDRQSFLEDKSYTQEQRLGSAHCQIVDRAVDGERAYVATREEQRSDDIRVGRESEPRTAELQHCAIMREVARQCGEGRAEDAID